MLVDVQALEGGLQNFEVMQEIGLQIGLPFDFVEWHFLGVGCVQQLAVDVARTQLLDFCEVSDSEVVDPLHDVMPGGEITTVTHIPNCFININYLLYFWITCFICNGRM